MLGKTGNVARQLRQVLDRSLFLPSAPQGARFAGWEGALVLVSFLALAVVLQLLRVGPSNALHSLFAEDGTVFLGGALANGFFADVSTPYAEYLVVIPRLIGELGAFVPLRDAAVVMNLASVLVVAASGVAVWYASSGHIHSPFLRAALVASMVLTPVASETVSSAANIAWHAVFAVFLLLFWRPATMRGACL